MREIAVVEAMPPIGFSEWFLWKNRHEVPGENLPGVYLLGRFEDKNPPKGKADPLDRHIVYVGEAKNRLSTRWGAFQSEAFGRGGSHSGATTYREMQYQDAEDALYVAAMPSSPLQWKAWANMPEAELTDRFAISSEELTWLKQYMESAPAKRKGPLNGAWIKFVERKLILGFVLKWGKLPDCNKE